MAGIYIHIPFCKQACYYCDFHFSTQTDLKERLVQALARELELQKEYLQKERIDTIYFGGGTPSLLSAGELDFILNTIHRYHPVTPQPEITLEANPDDLTKEKISDIRTVGINRLSIGIQSFDDAILKKLNRAHLASDALLSVMRAQEAGIHNISIDLIYSIPEQSDAQLLDNLEKACQLKPTHISTYSLTIEEKTVFGRWNQKGKFLAMQEDQSAKQFELVMDQLIERGFEHYEISNFAQPGFYSQHNTSYWQQKKYLGIGPSAHSYNFVSRQFNIANNSKYIQAIASGTLPSEVEILSLKDKINEHIFTGLRTQWGVNLKYLKETLHFNITTELKEQLVKLQKLKLITLDEAQSTLLLTREGKLVADQVAADLFQ